MILIGHGRIVAQGDKQALLASRRGAATSLVTSLDNGALTAALTAAGHAVQPRGAGLQVTATTEQIGRIALSAQIVLTDLRDGGASLEDLFLELTSPTQRDAIGATA
jgi:ABC-2 type transport system ATP-binding protein